MLVALCVYQHPAVAIGAGPDFWCCHMHNMTMSCTDLVFDCRKRAGP